ncbi:MAG: SGNH/GDSL hydrolase family protein [Bdellovibrionales bacterium]|nr:SGNH/GDSL hydrolase family protein [Bdellovibrionales bacterium]
MHLRPKTALIRVVLFLFGVAVPLVIIELIFIGTSLMSETPPSYQRIHSLAFLDTQGAPALPPHASGWHISYDGGPDLVVKLNSLGLPGPEPQVHAEHKVAFIGDSIVFNGGVPWEKSFLGLTTRALSEKTTQSWNLFNFGFNDGNFETALRTLESQVLPLKPDEIVFGVYLNDASGLIRPELGGAYSTLPDSREAIVSRSHTMRYLHYLLTRFDAIQQYRLNKTAITDRTRFTWSERFLKKTYRTDPQDLQLLIEEASNDWGAAWKKPFWDFAEAYLKKMKRLAESINASFSVILFPVSPQVEAQEPVENLFYPQEKMKKLALEIQIPFIDPLPQLIAHRGEDLFADQCHYTSRGNEILSEVLVPYFLDTYRTE